MSTKRYTGSFTALMQAPLNEDIAESPVELIQAEKMANLGLLLAGLAHEINNPANFAHNGALNLRRRMDQFYDLMMELSEGEENSDLRQLLNEKLKPMLSSIDIVIDGVERIQGIVQNVQMFTQQDQPSPSKDTLGHSLKKTLSLVQPTYRGVEFQCDILEDPVLEGWHFQLNQVFMNLTVNACQAMIKRAEREDKSYSPLLRVTLFSKDGFIKVTFQDNGGGISEDIQKLIFEPFFTTKPSKKGTGLGLAISQEIIELHKGTLDVISLPGQGSLFTVSIPI